MSLRNQRRLAAEVMKVGENRVWVNPEKIDDVEGVITRVEISKLVHEGTIRARPESGVSRARAKILSDKKRRGLKRGVGSRQGKKTARTPGKETWESRIRAIRAHLRILKDRRIIQKDVYRKLYLMAKGGAFSDTSRVEQYIDAHRLARRR
ncbi:MAG: large subunit ribosomal protein L19e [Thermoproteota archaeon]|nr:large subunit ribosomal protein L19e [Thermoproteota archaeon]